MRSPFSTFGLPSPFGKGGGAVDPIAEIMARAVWVFDPSQTYGSSVDSDSNMTSLTTGGLSPITLTRQSALSTNTRTGGAIGTAYYRFAERDSGAAAANGFKYTFVEAPATTNWSLILMTRRYAPAGESNRLTYFLENGVYISAPQNSANGNTDYQVIGTANTRVGGLTNNDDKHVFGHRHTGGGGVSQWYGFTHATTKVTHTDIAGVASAAAASLTIGQKGADLFFGAAFAPALTNDELDTLGYWLGALR